MKNDPLSRILIAAAVVLLAVRWLGIGYYYSGAAAADLMEDLTALHGEPYTGRQTETGTEDLTFSITGNTFFPTNYTLRQAFGWDYRYTCRATRTYYTDGKVIGWTTTTYVGIDPMGPTESDKHLARAYVDVSSAKSSSAMS